jgi:PTS system nitrogen regulatory IIA component
VPAGLGLVEALRAGGIARGVKGPDRLSVLRAVVDGLPLPEGFDREALFQLFVARESLGSTAVGNGIAIPHPRHPLILPVARPLVRLCFFEHPVDFRAPDREQVHTLFVLVCPTIRTHLRVLARMACLLRDESVRDVLGRRGSAAEVLAAVGRFEGSLDRNPPADRSGGE